MKTTNKNFKAKLIKFSIDFRTLETWGTIQTGCIRLDGCLSLKLELLTFLMLLLLRRPEEVKFMVLAKDVKIEDTYYLWGFHGEVPSPTRVRSDKDAFVDDYWTNMLDKRDELLQRIIH